MDKQQKQADDALHKGLIGTGAAVESAREAVKPFQIKASHTMSPSSTRLRIYK